MAVPECFWIQELLFHGDGICKLVPRWDKEGLCYMVHRVQWKNGLRVMLNVHDRHCTTPAVQRAPSITLLQRCSSSTFCANRLRFKTTLSYTE